MANTLTKDEILALAKNRGVKLAFLNDLIGGYRGRLTDWKNGKTTLSDNEVNIISDYLVGIEEHKTKHPPVKLPKGAVDELTNKAIESAKAAGMNVEVISVKASESEWDKILDGLSPESLVQLRDYVKFLYWKQAQVPADKT